MIMLFRGKKEKIQQPEDLVVGEDKKNNLVYKCSKTKLLYVLGKPPKKYISVREVTFKEETKD